MLYNNGTGMKELGKSLCHPVPMLSFLLEYLASATVEGSFSRAEEVLVFVSTLCLRPLLIGDILHANFV